MAVPEFKPGGVEYVYVELADHVAARIAARELKPGNRLPGEREMAAEYGVSLDTVRRALAVLRERGLVVTKPVKGTFVA